MSAEVIAFPRTHRSDTWRELARQLRDAAEWMDRAGNRGSASSCRREAARLEHDATACGWPVAGRVA